MRDCKNAGMAMLVTDPVWLAQLFWNRFEATSGDTAYVLTRYRREFKPSWRKHHSLTGGIVYVSALQTERSDKTYWIMELNTYQLLTGSYGRTVPAPESINIK